MKKIHALSLSILFTLAFTACASNSAKSSSSTLAKPIGENPFAGSSYANETTKFDFNSDGTAVVYWMNPQTKEWETQSKAKYSWDTGKNQFYIQMTSIFDKETELKSKEEAEAHIYKANKEEQESFLEGIEVSEASKKVLDAYEKEYIKNGMKSFFDKIETFNYSFSEEGELVLEAPLDTGLSNKQLVGQDKSMDYQVAIESTKMTIAKIKNEEGVEQKLENFYLGNISFNDEEKTFEASIYKLEQTIDEESGNVTAEEFSKTGKIKAAYTHTEPELVTEYQSDYVKPYTLTYTINFTSCPKELSELKSLEIQTHAVTGKEIFKKLEDNK